MDDFLSPMEFKLFKLFLFFLMGIFAFTLCRLCCFGPNRNSQSQRHSEKEPVETGEILETEV